MQPSIIPANVKGKQNDLAFSADLPNREDAKDCFIRAYKRLLNPRVWHELTGAMSASFALFDGSGQPAHRLAEVGDHFRIDVPGPGPVAGDGYDWVRVEAIEDRSDPEAEEELFAMKIQPSPKPGAESEDTAHFFEGSSSSTFVIKRVGNTVSSAYHGRNEVPNDNTDQWTDNIRNAAIAGAALLGLSEAQWSALTRSFLAAEIGGAM